MGAGLHEDGTGDGRVDPREPAEPHPVDEEVVERSHRDRRARGVDRERIPARTAGRAEAPALAHGDELDRVDAADLTPCGVDQASGMNADARLEEGAPAARRQHEADVLAVGLVGRAQPEGRGAHAHLGLRQPADGKATAGQLGATEHVQHVRLVLGPIRATTQPHASVRRLHDPGVVPGRDRVEAELVGPAQQAVELQPPVALDARVGRAARRVRGNVGLDDVRVEVVGEREHPVVDAQLLGNAPRIVDVGDRTAARVGRATPQLHRHTHDLVALLEEDGGRDGRVDAAGHGDEHAHRLRPSRAGARPPRAPPRGHGRRRTQWS